MKNNTTRIARYTFDIVFLLLLILPLLSFLLCCANEGLTSFSHDFNAFVSENFTYSKQIENTISTVVGYFDDVNSGVCSPAYLAYVVTATIAFVFVNILCFVPKLCNKLLKGWV